MKQESSSECALLRWIPNGFVDILYEHTQDLLEKSGVRRQPLLRARAHQIRVVPKEKDEPGSRIGSHINQPQEENSVATTPKHISDPGPPFDSTNHHNVDRLSSSIPHRPRAAVLEKTECSGDADVTTPDLEVEKPEYFPGSTTPPKKNGWWSNVEQVLQQRRLEDQEMEKRRIERTMWDASLGYNTSDDWDEYISPESVGSSGNLTSPSKRLSNEEEGSSRHGQRRQLRPATVSDNRTATPADVPRRTGFGPPGHHALSHDSVPSIEDISDQYKKQYRILEVQEWLEKSEVGSAGTPWAPALDQVYETWQQENLYKRSTRLNYSDSESSTDQTDGKDSKTLPKPQKPVASQKTRSVPPSSNSAMMRFRVHAKDIEFCSIAATEGSRSEASETVLIPKWTEGLGARNEYFANNKDDRQLQVVQGLLRKWISTETSKRTPTLLEKEPLIELREGHA